MRTWIINFMNQFGYLGIFLLITLENVFPPIPSEIILTFGGYMTTISKLEVGLVIIISTLGSIVGAIILYMIGYFLNQERLKKMVTSKFGKLLSLKEKDIDEATIWFTKKGFKSIFLGRFIPIIRSLISIPAGISKMPIKRFIIYTTLGSLIWNSLLIFLGYFLGDNWEVVSNLINTYSKFVLIILILIVSITIYKKKCKKQ